MECVHPAKRQIRRTPPANGFQTSVVRQAVTTIIMPQPGGKYEGLTPQAEAVRPQAALQPHSWPLPSPSRLGSASRGTTPSRTQGDPNGDGEESSRAAAAGPAAYRGLISSGRMFRLRIAHSPTSNKDGNHVLHQTLTAWRLLFG